MRFCDVCGNVSERERCRYCADARRDPTIVCVVEEPKDVLAVERTREFKGRYHVLGGALDPLAGIGPDALRIRELLARLGGTGPAPDETEIAEVIIATDPNTEGEATATYLVRLLRDFPGLIGHPARLRPADGRRPGVRRRADPGSGPVRPPRPLLADRGERGRPTPAEERWCTSPVRLPRAPGVVTPRERAGADQSSHGPRRGSRAPEAGGLPSCRAARPRSPATPGPEPRP